MSPHDGNECKEQIFFRLLTDSLVSAGFVEANLRRIKQGIGFQLHASRMAYITFEVLIFLNIGVLVYRAQKWISG